MVKEGKRRPRFSVLAWRRMFSLPNQVLLGADHAGFELKQAIAQFLQAKGFQVEDLSPTLVPGDDYPVIAHQVATRIAEAPDTTWGVLVCGTGVGVSIEANRHPGVRAALVHDAKEAELARIDDHANILTLGGRTLALEELSSLLEAWLNAIPSNDPRHLRRIEEIDSLNA